MHIKHVKLASFAVLGKLGSTKDGQGFVQRLWQHANEQFGDVKHLALTNEFNDYMGFWGLMSDYDMNFMPWDHYQNGYYLAGVEVDMHTKAPEGWTKWIFPSCECIAVKVEGEYQACIAKGLDYLKAHHYTLAAAMIDFMDPLEQGQPYIYFPIKRL